jgi:16S rRNA (cytosine1402-N4)-methyltransferase
MHIPVLLQETIEHLNIKKDNIYIDGTGGDGGHSEAILKKLNHTGTLIIIDKDPIKINLLKNKFHNYNNIIYKNASFANIKNIIIELNLLNKINGIIFDLGISSTQLDVADRGFSFLRDGPLDMRIDQSSGFPVYKWLNSATFYDIENVIRNYGEEKQSKIIAQLILTERKNNPITTTFDLVKIIKKIFQYKYYKTNPATKTFQSLRIFINNELKEIQEMLKQLDSIITLGGRIAIISFHSLEDRMIKNYFNFLIKNNNLIYSKYTTKLPIILPQASILYKWILKKGKPNINELNKNRRSRSAILRIIEKLY